MRTFCLSFLLAFFAFGTSVSLAQSYHPVLTDSSGAWTNVFFLYGSGARTDTLHYTHEEMVVDSTTYRKIFNREGTLKTLIREDTATRQVFYWDDWANAEYVLYDFSLQAGDTFVSWDNSTLTVDYVDTISTLAGPRKRLHLLGNFGTSNYQNFGDWVEGLGDISNSFFYPREHPVWDAATEFRCAFKEGQQIYGMGNCELNFSGREELVQGQLAVYPQPVSGGELTVDFGRVRNGEAEFALVDLQGRVVWRAQRALGGVERVELAGLEGVRGMYVLRVVVGGEVLLGRVILE